jgi:hypothetical protein
MKFKDYEVAAIALNGCKNCYLYNIQVLGNRKNIPVLGTFSSARFIRPYIDYLVSSGSNVTLNLFSGPVSSLSIRDRLRYAINNVTMDILNGGMIDKITHPAEYAVFHNPAGIIDGNAYGILFNKFGIAVNGHPSITNQDESTFSQNIHLENVTIFKEYSDVREVISLGHCSSMKITSVIDAVGAAFQVFNKDPSGNYITISNGDVTSAIYQGNMIANAQALVGKAALLGSFSGSSLDVTRSGFTPELLSWIESNTSLSNYSDYCPLLCNGDAMFHVQKGLIGLKMDAVIGATVKSLLISELRNSGQKGSDICSYNTTSFSHPLASLPGYNGVSTIGISVSGSRSIFFSDITIDNIQSFYGPTIGIDILLDSSNITLSNVNIKNIISGKPNQTYPVDGPNYLPLSIGIKISKSAKDIDIGSPAIDGLSSDYGARYILDERVITATDSSSTESSSSTTSNTFADSTEISYSDSGSLASLVLVLIIFSLLI